MIFARIDYILWFVTLAAELYVAIRLRRSRHASLRYARVYLMVQVLAFAPLYVASLFSMRLYFYLFFADCMMNYAALFALVAAIHYDFRGTSKAFGSVWTWVVGCTFTGLALGYSIIIEPPPAHYYIQFLATAEQALTYAVGLSLFGVLLYGWVAASSWPRVPCLVWVGTALYIAADSFSTEAALLHNYARFFWAHYLPSLVFFITLYLWNRANSTANQQTEST